MKFFILLFVLAFSTTGFTKELYTYKCTSNAKNSKEQTLVTVKELANVTEEVTWGQRYDLIYKVKVDIVQTLNGKVTKNQSFVNYATVEEVVYTISAVKKEGVSVHIYLDEADDASIVFTDSDGTKKSVGLTCL